MYIFFLRWNAMPHIEQEIQRLVLLSLAEDRAPFDITSHACVPADKIVSADLILKEDSIIAGLQFPPLNLSNHPQLFCRSLKVEGQAVLSGMVIASMKGSTFHPSRRAHSLKSSAARLWDRSSDRPMCQRS